MPDSMYAQCCQNDCSGMGGESAVDSPRGLKPAVPVRRAIAPVRIVLVSLAGLLCAAGCRTTAVKTQADRSGFLVAINTNLGEFVVELDAELAPRTAINFARNAQDGIYDGTVFHRVVAGSVIQGGDYLPSMEPKDRATRDALPFEGHSELSNVRGTIAMARSAKPSAPPTQFFINLVDNSAASDHGTRRRGYAVFGHVVEGMATVDRISETAVASHRKYAAGRPEPPPVARLHTSGTTASRPAVASHRKYAAGRLAVVPVEPVVIKTVRPVNPDDLTRLSEAVAAKDRRIAEEADHARWATEHWLEDYIAEAEKEAGREFTTTESGLRYIDRRTGKGPVPTIHDRVEVHYQGMLTDGTEFETSYHAAFPSIFEVGRVNLGWQEALQTMHVGSLRTIIVPPDLAFGEGGIPGHIPPNATLIYDIDLLDLK